MVEIIEMGKFPTAPVQKCRCAHCSTLFSFRPYEAKLNSDQRDGDYYSINCPLCGKICTRSVTYV